VEVVFQVNGKVRAKASVAKDMDKAALEKLAMENERMKEFMKGMTVVKSIVVPGKLVNIVVKPA
jgi:leucyl-tRNA synthetase